MPLTHGKCCRLGFELDDLLHISSGTSLSSHSGFWKHQDGVSLRNAAGTLGRDVLEVSLHATSQVFNHCSHAGVSGSGHDKQMTGTPLCPRFPSSHFFPVFLPLQPAQPGLFHVSICQQAAFRGYGITSRQPGKLIVLGCIQRTAGSK